MSKKIFTTSDYPLARINVFDGDVLILRSPWNHSPLAAATICLLKTAYTHTGHIIRIDNGLFVAEMVEGELRLRPLSKYRKTNWDVFECPVDRMVLRTAILDHVRTGVDYDWFDLARIAWHRTTGHPLPAQDDEKMVCSSFTAHVMLEHADWRPRKLPTIAAPPDLARVLWPPKLRYRHEEFLT